MNVLNYWGAAALACALAACGGSDDGSPNASSTTLQSAQKAASGALLMQSMASKIAGSAANRAAKQAQSFTINCDAGGTIEYNQSREPSESPFTAAEFEVDSFDFNACSLQDSEGGTVTTTGLDGRFQFGEPPEDPRNILAARYGRVTEGANDDQPFTLQVSEGSDSFNVQLLGTIDALEEDAGTRLDIRQTLLAQINFSETTAEGTESGQLLARLGTPDAPFRATFDDQGGVTNVTLDGELEYIASEAASDCATGNLSFQTLQPLTLNASDEAIGGRIAITADGERAELQFNSDGSADILVNGESIQLNADTIRRSDDDCVGGEEVLDLLFETSLALPQSFVEED